jgi:hypothetical protein
MKIAKVTINDNWFRKPFKHISPVCRINDVYQISEGILVLEGCFMGVL